NMRTSSSHVYPWGGAAVRVGGPAPGGPFDPRWTDGDATSGPSAAATAGRRASRWAEGPGPDDEVPWARPAADETVKGASEQDVTNPGGNPQRWSSSMKRRTLDLMASAG